LLDFIHQDLTANPVPLAFFDSRQNRQNRFGLKAYSFLGLVVKWTVETASIEIDFGHFDFQKVLYRQNRRLSLSLADLQFPILPWEEFSFVEPCIHAVFGQAGIESAHGVTVRMGVAEEDFEGAVAVNGLHNG